jgi:hypothetical protein
MDGDCIFEHKCSNIAVAIRLVGGKLAPNPPVQKRREASFLLSRFASAAPAFGGLFCLGMYRVRHNPSENPDHVRVFGVSAAALAIVCYRSAA